MKKIFGLMTMFFAIGMFIACDNGTTSGSNNNNNNQNALHIPTLTEWVNDPARRGSIEGGPFAELNTAIRLGFIAAAPELWGATSAVYKNDHTTYARMMAAWLEAEGMPAPVVITKGKQFDASAIAVKNLLVSI